MTANELLAMLGRAWSRLLIYPGGLAAFATAWLVFTVTSKAEPRTKNREPANRPGSRFLVLGSIVPPWLALALLPLPLAVALPRQIDIVVALALLEWPNLLAIRQELRAGEMRRLAAALNSYPPLILATLALIQAGHSLELAALARAPGDLASISAIALHWLGAVALALALPPALGIGPFADDREPTTDRPFDTAQGRRLTTDDRRPTTNDRRIDPSPITSTQPPSPIPHPPSPNSQIGLRLRALGLVTLAALPWAGSEDTSLALLRMLGATALIAALLWGFDRLTRGQAARRWAWAYLALDASLLLALLWAAYQALQSRLA